MKIGGYNGFEMVAERRVMIPIYIRGNRYMKGFLIYNFLLSNVAGLLSDMKVLSEIGVLATPQRTLRGR